jgi:hypothetical protein
MRNKGSFIDNVEYPKALIGAYTQVLEGDPPLAYDPFSEDLEPDRKPLSTSGGPWVIGRARKGEDPDAPTLVLGSLEPG